MTAAVLRQGAAGPARPGPQDLPAEPLLLCQGVSKWYGPVIGVNRVTLARWELGIWEPGAEARAAAAALRTGGPAAAKERALARVRERFA